VKRTVVADESANNIGGISENGCIYLTIMSVFVFLAKSSYHINIKFASYFVKKKN
jgi:hypothetical protein